MPIVEATSSQAVIVNLRATCAADILIGLSVSEDGVRVIAMARTVTITNRETPTEQTRVCHFDELSEQAKDCLLRTIENEITAEVDPEIATELVQYDLIKFVEYYDVRLTDHRASGSVSA